MTHLTKLFARVLAAVAAGYDTLAQPQLALADGSLGQSTSFADNFAERLSYTEVQGRDEDKLAQMRGDTDTTTLAYDAAIIGEGPARLATTQTRWTEAGETARMKSDGPTWAGGGTTEGRVRH